MELTKVDVDACEQITKPAEQLRELSDLQLALVGGGIGEVILG